MKDCILIATLPNLGNKQKVEQVISNGQIAEVRFNTGTPSPYSVEGTLDMLKNLSEKYNKRLWVDIKGRQLRVSKSVNPLYSSIELNHIVQVSYPATITFHDGDTVNITHIKNGNNVFVDPLPRQILGAGQSVNIKSEFLVINGYLTESDKEYLKASKKFELKNFMASYVEDFSDIVQIYDYVGSSVNLILKIESLKGIDFMMKYKPFNVDVLRNSGESYLMAARDDLFIEVGQRYKTIRYLKSIRSKDKNAICASSIFSSLESRDKPLLADYEDLELMYLMGYRKFMLSDDICNYSFEKAIKAWSDFING